MVEDDKIVQSRRFLDLFPRLKELVVRESFGQTRVMRTDGNVLKTINRIKSMEISNKALDKDNLQNPPILRGRRRISVDLKQAFLLSRRKMYRRNWIRPRKEQLERRMAESLRAGKPTNFALTKKRFWSKVNFILQIECFIQFAVSQA
jgi:hypothetical protein